MKKLHLVALLLVALFFTACPEKQEVVGGPQNPFWRADQLVKKGVYTASPLGAKLYTEAGVTLNAQEKDAVDEGLTAVFEKVRCNYPNTPKAHPAFQYSEWEVLFFQSEVTPGGNVAFRVPCGSYCGTQWDQGGYIYAAAMVTGVVGETYTIAVPDVKLDRYEQLKKGTEFEGEHWWLASVDGAKYELTKIHGVGQGHPIIPDCQASLKQEAQVPALRVQDPQNAYICILPVE